MIIVQGRFTVWQKHILHEYCVILTSSPTIFGEASVHFTVQYLTLRLGQTGKFAPQAETEFVSLWCNTSPDLSMSYPALKANPSSSMSWRRPSQTRKENQILFLKIVNILRSKMFHALQRYKWLDFFPTYKKGIFIHCKYLKRILLGSSNLSYYIMSRFSVFQE